MKILCIFILLICVTPIFAYTILNNKYSLINELSVNNMYKRNVADDEYNKISKECRTAIEDIKGKCLMKDTIEMANLNSFCLNYDTDMCQSLYINGTKSIPACKNEDLSIFNMNVTIIYFYKRYRCAVDENGKPCPFSIMDSSNRKARNIDKKPKPLEQTEKEFYTHINNTCKSKMCLNVFRNYVEDFKSVEDVERVMNQTVLYTKKIKRHFEVEHFGKNNSMTFQNAIKYLDTDECQQIYKDYQNELMMKKAEEDGEDSENGFGVNLFNHHNYRVYLTITIILFMV